MNRKDLPQSNATCEVCGRKYYICKKCIEMKNRGIETWRSHCDSFECYQTLIFANRTDVDNITKKEYEDIISLELPDGNKPVKEIENKLNAIRRAVYGVKIHKETKVEDKSGATRFKKGTDKKDNNVK